MLLPNDPMVSRDIMQFAFCCAGRLCTYFDHHAFKLKSVSLRQELATKCTGCSGVVSGKLLEEENKDVPHDDDLTNFVAAGDLFTLSQSRQSTSFLFGLVSL